MPRSCVVGGCTRNFDANPDVCWLTFPKAPAVRREWVRFVNTTRSDFRLSEWSRICSAHFDEDAVDETVKMKRRLGLTTKFKLKDGAVPSLKAPTIQQVDPDTASASSTSTSSSSSARARQSGGAFLKRERARVSLCQRRT